MEHNTLDILVANRCGVLLKVATLFSGRGCNIHAMNACATEQNPALSRITLEILDQTDKVKLIAAQLGKLEDVKEVSYSVKETES